MYSCSIATALSCAPPQLKQDPADADLLDEYVRALLHVGRPDEIVILLDMETG